MGINNPIPRSLKSETKKAAKILASFVKPNQVFGADQVIPPDVLKRAKGLAIITILKAGFLFSGRAGSGVIVARLKDGTWSAPSAIAMAGAGAGGMVGIELTDFVFILNTQDAVKSFSEFGTITLGGNVSVSAGPLGRSAEAAASASAGGVAAVFAYSKSKGLFAGVSVEGSAIIERREANRKFYGDNCTAKMILSGRIRPPPAVDPLFRVLESRAFNYRPSNGGRGSFDDDEDDYYDDDDYYNDIPSSFSSTDASSTRPNTRSTRRRAQSGSRYTFDDDDDDDDYGTGYSRNSRLAPTNSGGSGGKLDDPSGASSYYASHRRSGTAQSRARSSRNRWADDEYDDYDDDYESGYRRGNGRDRTKDREVDDLSNRFSKSRISSASTPQTSQGRFTAPTSPSPSSPKAVALYSFAGEESGDLPFRKGDVITILKKSDSQNDWWTGRVNGREGIFPANYVELV
ncbi:CPA_1a_G0017320.mRNA.1.CDS.1 [Saccharomyces cerevisiae]|nr:Lsb3p [Saccharomyces cerevisiae YJM1399]CAI4435679.1 CPI_1c_G0017330.mRNA.1.CDS.1 [Saccharomyces cerevisiae]CAI4436829.1 CPA_1a_G0017320.mRNA.1.CDS.1 [Saccharomyces cerevisiae]CAI4449763.1 ADE_G0017100.mRNA.1.CDS.1 [Saccharomyces cerevisiae]CAI4450458.1 BBM_1a_G0017250.mRNA.1.CDS.1 [Saccharomyces cerevisiae]